MFNGQRERNCSMDTYILPDTLIVEGKTKIVKAAQNQGCVTIGSKIDITAGDGKKHDQMKGKDVLANNTACNVFRFLELCGVSTSFMNQIDDTSFLAHRCNMLPYEVVARREACGSYLKRKPHLPEWHVFPKLVVEFFLKTSGKVWKEHALPCDDPLMVFEQGGSKIKLFIPNQPIESQDGPFLALSIDEVFSSVNEWDMFPQMEDITRRVFLLLEKAWHIEGRGHRLIDFKLEFGLDFLTGDLLLSDVVDADSWRVIAPDGTHVSKEAYRQGESLSVVADKYAFTEHITGRFKVPQQQLILWRGSESDTFDEFWKALRGFDVDTLDCLSIEEVTCSMHKQPQKGLQTLTNLVRKIPDSVGIGYVGMSNGAGPTLSAHTHIPVISVPESFGKFPEDVWSSLRTPSNVPTMTVLSPKNAVRAALGMLSAHNPVLYAGLREGIESRAVNVCSV